jgi:hypothetical protein
MMKGDCAHIVLSAGVGGKIILTKELSGIFRGWIECDEHVGRSGGGRHRKEHRHSAEDSVSSAYEHSRKRLSELMKKRGADIRKSF